MPAIARQKEPDFGKVLLRYIGISVHNKETGYTFSSTPMERTYEHAYRPVS